jgi:hypothetical protein
VLTGLALFVKYFDCVQPRHALVKHAGFEEFDNLLGPRVTAKEIVEDLEAASE